jgi:hypothetical protein
MTTIRFTEPQLALIARANDCNFKDLVEVSFDFASDGKVLDCKGIIAGRTVPDGGELALLLNYAHRRFAARPAKTATVIPFPGGGNA